MCFKTRFLCLKISQESEAHQALWRALAQSSHLMTKCAPLQTEVEGNISVLSQFHILKRSIRVESSPS